MIDGLLLALPFVVVALRLQKVVGAILRWLGLGLQQLTLAPGLN